MKTEMQTVEIACAADERFAMPLAVTLCSVASRLSRPMRAFVLFTDLSAKVRQHIQAACDKVKHPPTIQWIKTEQGYLRDQPVGLQHLSQATYLRLALGRMLPPDVKRVIYLDCDTLVVKDLAPLFDTPLDGQVIGAVREFMTPLAGAHNALNYCLADTGLSPAQVMFNAGILLLDLEAFRQQNVEADCLAFLDRWRNEVHSADQDALNAILHDRWKQLDYRWNVQVGSLDAFKTHPSLSAEDQQSLRELDPAILHFSGSAKPWNSGLRSAHCKTYLENLDQTRWFGQTQFQFWKVLRLARCVQTVVNNRVASIKDQHKRAAMAEGTA